MRALTMGEPLADPLEVYLRVDRSRPRHEAWVLGHMVAGLDGTAAVQGRVGALSTPADQVLFNRMRQLADVVLVGAETIRREGYGPIPLDPDAQAARVQLGLRPTPPLAIVSQSLNLNWSSSVFTAAPPHARPLVITGAAADPERRRVAEDVADVLIAGEDRVEPALVVRELAALGHRVILCEGGPTWLGQLAASGHLDELLLTIAPIMGGDSLPVAVTPDGGGLSHFRLCHVLADSGTLFLRYETKLERER